MHQLWHVDMGVLLVIRMLHALFIWCGDILFTYAIMGFVMIAFVRIPAKWMVPCCSVYIVPSGIVYGFTYFLNKLHPNALWKAMRIFIKLSCRLKRMHMVRYGEIFMLPSI